MGAEINAAYTHTHCERTNFKKFVLKNSLAEQFSITFSPFFIKLIITTTTVVVINQISAKNNGFKS